MPKHFALFAAGAVLSLNLDAAVSHGFAQCTGFFPQGRVPAVQAASPGARRELCFDSFAVLHSGQSKTPVYVVEKLNRASLQDARDEERTNRFYEEARLPPSERARLSDYAGTGYDRGHMAPAADMPNAQAMAQSFSLSNMVPQTPESNRKVWASIEKATRKYVSRAAGDVFVFSGPAYSGPVATIGAGKVWVPTHTYKLVYDARANRAWAHWTANSDKPRGEKPISYQELVKRTGIEFLPGLNPSS